MERLRGTAVEASRNVVSSRACRHKRGRKRVVSIRKRLCTQAPSRSTLYKHCSLCQPCLSRGNGTMLTPNHHMVPRTVSMVPLPPCKARLCGRMAAVQEARYTGMHELG